MPSRSLEPILLNWYRGCDSIRGSLLWDLDLELSAITRSQAKKIQEQQEVKFLNSCSNVIVTQILGLHARSLPLFVLLMHAFPYSGIRAVVSYLLLLNGSELIRICKI